MKSWIVVCIVWVVGMKSNTKTAQLGKKTKQSKQTNKQKNQSYQVPLLSGASRDCVSFQPTYREAEVIQITQKAIKIVQLREELVFDVKETGLFESTDGKRIFVNNTGTFPILSLFFRQN